MFGYIPMCLVILRFLLAPLLFWDAHSGTADVWFTLGFVAAIASDVFDGVIARRLKIVTEALREWDGRVDVWFYFWIALSIWQTHAEVLQTYSAPLLFVLGLQILAWVIDLIKFRRFNSYHHFGARALGASLFAVIFALFAFNQVGIFMWLAIGVGTICMVEEIAITLTLPRWQFDVPTLWHARRLRATMLKVENVVSKS